MSYSSRSKKLTQVKRTLEDLQDISCNFSWLLTQVGALVRNCNKVQIEKMSCYWIFFHLQSRNYNNHLAYTRNKLCSIPRKCWALWKVVVRVHLPERKLNRRTLKAFYEWNASGFVVYGSMHVRHGVRMVYYISCTMIERRRDNDNDDGGWRWWWRW